MDAATVRVLQAADAPETTLASWRREAGLRTATMLPEPEAGLLRGLLLGQQKAIDPPLWQDFNTTGTSWLIVISGAQITMLLLLVFGGARRLWYPWPSVLLAGAVVVLYAVFVGLGVPVARAAVMGVLYLGAQGLGRPVTPINLLAVAALTLTALDPNTIADAGFPTIVCGGCRDPAVWPAADGALAAGAGAGRGCGVRRGRAIDHLAGSRPAVRPGLADRLSRRDADRVAGGAAHDGGDGAAACRVAVGAVGPGRSPGSAGCRSRPWPI